MDNNTTILNIVKKQINDYGQDIGWTKGSTSEHTPSKFFKGLVKYKKQLLQNTDYYMILKDEFEFIVLNKVAIDDYLVWNNAKYHVVSIDNTIPNLYKCYGQFQTTMNTHTYSITINNDNPIDLKVGDKISMSCTCKDNDTIDNQPTITYKSSNDTIATISTTGLITSIKEGTVNITATYNTVSAIIQCNVTKADEYTIQCDDISIDMGSNVQLSPVCMKNGVRESNPSLTYISGNSSIATCSDNGLVNGIVKGSTTIIMEWEGVTKTINLTVNDVQVTYIINGNTNLIKGKQTTYTISPDLPTDNYSWELDEMSVEAELAEIVSSNQSQCILTTSCGDGEDVTLSAKVDGIVVASIDLTCTRK